MCMEDIRIGRKKVTRITQVTLANGVLTNICGASKDRTHLSIATVNVPAAAANAARATPLGGDAVGDAAYAIGGDKPPLEFDIETHGNLVTLVWNGSGVGANVAVLVVETFLEDR